MIALFRNTSRRSRLTCGSVSLALIVLGVVVSGSSCEKRPIEPAKPQSGDTNQSLLMPKTPEDQPIVGQIEFDTMKPKSRALSPEKSLVYALPIKLYGATRVPPSTGRISHDGKSFTQISSEYFFRPGVAMITITDYADDHSVIEQLLFSIQKRLESGQQDTEGIGLPDGVGLKFFIKEERKGKIDAVLRKRFHVVIDLQSIPQEVDPMLILQSINTSALFK